MQTMSGTCRLVISVLILAFPLSYSDVLSEFKEVNETARSYNLTKYLPPPLEAISSCYPEGASGQSQYLIGYGSLMQKASKDRTYPKTGDNVPVRVYGYERSWNCKGEPIGFSTTYLGATPSTNESAFFNAVVFKVPSAAALAGYDTRENYYCRREVLRSKLQLLSSKPSNLPNGQYWIYVTRPEHDEPPSESYPIVQSYVDTFISGCLEQQKLFKLPGFADECVDTTAGWSESWVNDRIYPRRPFLYQPMAAGIDRLLNEKLPEIFSAIKIEGR